MTALPRALAGLVLLLAAPSTAQDLGWPVAPHLLTDPWPARWIAHPTADRTAFGVYHFRKTFDLTDLPETFVVHVSADNRYRLYVNGSSVSRGPARGDVAHWRYESVDLAPYLRAGSNVVAAVVWYFADEAPMAQHMREAAFILQGNDEAASVLNTDASWKVVRSEAVTPIPMTRDVVDGYYVVGPGERIDGALYPWGWEQPGFDEAAWAEALALREGYPRGSPPNGGMHGWMLVPRQIPPMEESFLRIPRLRRSEGLEAHDGFLNGTRALVVPPRTEATVLVDQTHLTTAYPTLVVSGGAGASVHLRYAEALFSRPRVKGNRDEVEGKFVRGNFDTFLPDGSDRRAFEPLWFRTYRYIQLEIETTDDSLTIHDLYGTFTGYPFEERAAFASDDSTLAAIWDVGWRTARLCAGEHYYDCPYYEQLQYVGDTRIQALISLYVSGDDRLVRRALRDFDHSRIPEGITASRYPSRLPQYIPTYALFWVAMVHDYWMHRDDPGFVGGFLTGIRGVIDWYAGYLNDDGLLGGNPWWNFVDWTTAYRGGVPPGADDGVSSIINLQFVYTLGYAAELADAFARPDEAAHYRALADSVRRAVMAACWDDDRGLVADDAEGSLFSQHANILAVLTDAVPPADQRDLMERVLSDTSLVQASFYFQFYLHRAMAKAGMGDRYLDQMEAWRDMLALGLTTFAERPDYPGSATRSDCHAWSASPTYHFLALVAGITPDAPGFRTVRIEPRLGPLARIEGSMPHPLGDIAFRLERAGDGIAGTVTLPEGLTGTFVWNGRETALGGGTQTVE